MGKCDCITTTKENSFVLGEYTIKNFMAESSISNLKGSEQKTHKPIHIHTVQASAAKCKQLVNMGKDCTKTSLPFLQLLPT